MMHFRSNNMSSRVKSHALKKRIHQNNEQGCDTYSQNYLIFIGHNIGHY